MTTKYTLPGVMQYLQAQFAQAERNRMQGDLERAALKLKVIELEHERNALKRRVEDLEHRLNATGGEARAKGEAGSGSETDIAAESLDVDKLLRARRFLASATNEIIYLLKAPVVELGETSEESVSPVSESPIDAFNVEQPEHSRIREPKSTQSPPLGEPFHADSDAETIVDGGAVLTSSNGTPAVMSAPAAPNIKLSEFGAKVELRGGKAVVRYASAVAIYDMAGNDLCRFDVSPDVNVLESTQTYVAYATGTEVRVCFYTGGEASYDVAGVTHVDANEDTLVVLAGGELRVLAVGEGSIREVARHELAGIETERGSQEAPESETSKGSSASDSVLTLRLLAHHPSYDLALLTPSSLILYSLEAASSGPLTPLSDIQLAPFSRHLLTPLALLVQFEHGLYAMDLGDTTEFTSVPCEGELGYAHDDPSIFYVWSHARLRVFQTTAIGTVAQLRSLDGVSRDCALGDVGGHRMVVGVNGMRLQGHIC